ncbi:MAG: hypothetical protein LPK00_03090 [Bacillaceae bacterium]|nr:hypothetical protein [Bacillaceae bacterium]
MTRDDKRIHCGNCMIPLRDDDLVVLDWINTLIHMNCFERDTAFILDIGTYQQLVYKYDFFENQRVKN